MLYTLHFKILRETIERLLFLTRNVGSGSAKDFGHCTGEGRDVGIMGRVSAIALSVVLNNRCSRKKMKEADVRPS